MRSHNIALVLFACFSFAFPLWAMQNNSFQVPDNNRCTGDCYEAWKAETGGTVALAVAQAEARASASPAELGKALYTGCVACHGANGEGGVGPMLAGQAEQDIVSKLQAYKAGETIGAQSALMWSQAGMLSTEDMENLAAYIATL